LVRVLPEYRQRADVWAVSTTRLETSAKVRVAVRYLQEGLSKGAHALRGASQSEAPPPRQTLPPTLVLSRMRTLK
jgi:hypothetical protein